MLKRLAITTLAAGAIAIAGATATFATPSPSGPGQPNQSCQALTAAPAGFSTAGFAHAETVYAGSGHSTVSNNPNAVSQYDVACFQLSSH